MLAPLALLALGSSAAASSDDEAWLREDAPDGTEASGGEKWVFRPYAVGLAFARSDFDSLQGSVVVQRASVGISAYRPLDEEYTASVGLRVGRSHYGFAESTFTTAGKDPFDGLYRATIWAGLSRAREEAFLNWNAGVFSTVGAESGADLGDAATFGLSGSVRMQLSDTFALTLGLVGTTRLEDSFLVFPISAIDWQISEDVHVGDEGSGFGVGVDLGDDFRTYTNLAFSVHQFRLEDEGIGTQQAFPGGVFRDDVLSANVGLVWTPTERFAAEVFAGLAWREITFLQDGGGGLADDVDATPLIGLSVSYGL